MTTGALMFAFDTPGIDYMAMAAWNAQRIRKHLGIPVAVVTNHVGRHQQAFDRVILCDPQGTDTRYFEDLDRTVTWHNAGRPEAWDLTPWDRTLLLDTDYVIDSAELAWPLDQTSSDILAFRQATDITGMTHTKELNRFGRYHMPMWWATVVIFNRSTTARWVFDSMKMVRNNWQHYRDLYGIDRKTYRNDHALTIALGILDGHTDSVRAIPWTMSTVMPGHLLTKDGDYFRAEWCNQSGKRDYVLWHRMDFHAMGKAHLQRIIDASY